MQRLPDILREVHDLVSLHGDRYRFALSGSSARKLKQAGVDLLPGRVVHRSFFPLTTQELGYPEDIQQLLRVGSLPPVHERPTLALDLLETYATTYLREEIQQEALVREVRPFARFLRVAALVNSQVINTAGIARDAAVARSTVQGYFDLLVDTLVGIWLPAWQPRAKVREASKPKFYFFDCGVVRSLSNHLRVPVSDADKGPLLETLILHELRAATSLTRSGGELSYWRTPAGVEIDFIWSVGDFHVGIEVKASERWLPSHGKALKSLMHQGVLQRAYGVYLGDRTLQDGTIPVLPAQEFFQLVHQGHRCCGMSLLEGDSGTVQACASSGGRGGMCKYRVRMASTQRRALSARTSLGPRAACRLRS